MSQDTTVISKCRDLRLSDSSFKTYNRPARILALLAIIIPLAIVIPTSSEDEAGEIDYTTSPYAAYAGIIFLAGAVIAYFLSRKANSYKIRNNQKWAIKTLNAYENLNEYERKNAPEDYLDKAENSLDDLVNDIRSKVDETDDKIQWIIPFVNPIEELVTVLDNEWLPLVNTGDKTKIPNVKTYLVKLMKYFLSPSSSLLKELVSEEIPSGEIIMDEDITITRRPLPFRNVGVFGIFGAIGIAIYFLAIEIEVDKSSAFLAAAMVAGALSGGFFTYMKK